MKLLANHGTSAEHLLGTASLELVRSNLERDIQENDDLTFEQQRNVLKELDFLIAFERIRRIKLAINQWQLEALQHESVVLQQRQDIENKLRIAQAQTDKVIASLKQDISNLTLDRIERALTIKRKLLDTREAGSMQNNLEKLKVEQLFAKKKEEAFHKLIAERAWNRAKFIKLVQDEFPDMADDMVEFYDDQVFQQTRRR